MNKDLQAINDLSRGVSSYTLKLMQDRLAICRLPPGSSIPEWAWKGRFSAVIRTPNEMTVVCDNQLIPDNEIAVSGWRALEVQGPLDFSEIGVLASLSHPLAGAGVSIYALSTYDTDYLLVKEGALLTAIKALRAAGHTVHADA